MKKINILIIIFIIIFTACSRPENIQASKDIKEFQNTRIEESKEKSQLSKEVQENNNSNKWNGQWRGKSSSYYSGSELNIKALDKNLIEFEITAFNGCHTGGYSGDAKIENGKAIHETEDEIEFIFKLDEKGEMQLESNDYTYYCGQNVSFDSKYVKELDIQQPIGVNVGLVDTSDQEKIFKDLTGDMYDVFIDYAQYYSDEENYYENYRIRTFGLLGYSNAAVVMLDNEKNNIIAAVDSGSGVHYYTNDEEHENGLPKFIEEWLGGREIVNIDSNTKEDSNQIGIEDIPEIYINHIKEKFPDDNIMFYEKEDIDSNGKAEVIIGTGKEDDDSLDFAIFNHIYLFKEDEGKIHYLSENLAQNAYGVNQVKLVELEGLDGKFIYCRLTNGARLSGFQLYQFLDDEVRLFADSCSATGVGEDILKDFNGNGQFDGYVSIRSSYDTLYYHLVSNYILKENAFVLEKTIIENMPPYPNEIQEVISHYLALRILDNGKSEDIKKRLEELTLNNEVNQIEIKSKQWYKPLLNTILDIEEVIEFKIKEEESKKFVEATYQEEEEQMGLIFYIIKKDGKWCISSIKAS